MKYLITIILLFCYMFSFGQENNRIFYQTKNRIFDPYIYYVDIQKTVAYVFCVDITYSGKKASAGIGISIVNVDTVFKQTNGSYLNKKTKVNIFNEKGYLLFKDIKKKKLYLVNDEEIKTVNYILNGAYYLKNYFDVIREINDNYPLCSASINNYILYLINIKSDYIEFRKKTTDERVFFIKDSITSIQDKYVTTKNYILKNVKIIDYNTLKDSLIKLPPNNLSKKYYTMVIEEISKERPVFYFKLAEDFPENRNLIFSVYNDDAIPTLKIIEGHDEVKALFFKQKKHNSFKKNVVKWGAFIIFDGLLGGLYAWHLFHQ